MDAKQIMKIFEDTAYVRMGGSAEELRCAQYLAGKCAELGLEATVTSFPVDMATMQEAVLTVQVFSIALISFMKQIFHKKSFVKSVVRLVLIFHSALLVVLQFAWVQE